MPAFAGMTEKEFVDFLRAYQRLMDRKSSCQHGMTGRPD
jgi:hypothetical protein